MRCYLACILTGFTTRTYEAVMQAEKWTESRQSQFFLTICWRNDGKLYFPQSRLDRGAPSWKMLIFIVSISEQNIFSPHTSYAGLSSTPLTNMMLFAIQMNVKQNLTLKYPSTLHTWLTTIFLCMSLLHISWEAIWNFSRTGLPKPSIILWGTKGMF